MNPRQSIGNRLAPARFIAFCLVAAIAVPAAILLTDWSRGTMLGFDAAALVFLGSCLPLLGSKAEQVRKAARENDANRVILLVISGVASLAVLAAVAAELGGSGKPSALILALVVATLALAWMFGNTVYALHYAHVFYSRGDAGRDAGGIDFPESPRPVYWDFVYFAFTLGMTFQTSDVQMTTTRMRKVATFHCLAAFVFNLGVIAFTINVLGGS